MRSARQHPWGLIALNAALLALLGAVTFAPSAEGQVRRRGNYVMVAGGAPNTLSSVVYILDTVNQEMMVLRYDATNRSLGGVAYRDVAADAAELTRGRSRAGG